ncbi:MULTISPECIES: hypothetical protein [Arthrobacter]|uniref:Uncharacterized protein n=2 Tax=Arthrobacter TaxID=1663 RepID=A0ABU9KI07_9MICC|nr:hypothetical protein [Arthrobacter sp. YJM1]MDP5226455.1 hypothetical protein [Arthrobacter sp. YJM1]
MARLVARLVSLRKGAVRHLLFCPDLAWHPLEDHAEVFSLACADLGEDAVLLDETPLLFAGLQAKNLFARRVESVGFLVTDQGLYVRDAPSTPVEPAEVRSVEFDWSADPATEAQRVARLAGATFDRRWAETLTSREALQGAVEVVREVVELVLAEA